MPIDASYQSVVAKELSVSGAPPGSVLEGDLGRHEGGVIVSKVLRFFGNIKARTGKSLKMLSLQRFSTFCAMDQWIRNKSSQFPVLRLLTNITSCENINQKEFGALLY